MKKMFKNPVSYRHLLLLTIACFMLCIGLNNGLAQAKEKSDYLIKVNRVFNTVTVYEKDDAGEYTVPVKAMLCSVGKDGKTVKGTFQTKAKYRWKLLMGDVWGQYSTRIVGGILFHSVYYYENGNPASLATKEFNKLGTAASHGCIRLAVEDAKWIYDNCDVGTTVTIYDDKKNPGPLGKPDAIKIAANVRWDPTDPDEDNPYLDKQPAITGIKNTSIDWNGKIDLMKGLKATSSVGVDITSDVQVEGKINPLAPGKYQITYSVTDALNKTTNKTITITVKNNTAKPKFEGVSDKVVGVETKIDKEFVLSDITASCKGKQLSEDLIKVAIKKINKTAYKITYKASIGNGPVSTKISKIYIDDEGPVFAGIADMTIEEGIIPDISYVMADVTVSDNYTATEDINVSVDLLNNEDGTYSVTYTAIDSVGNKVMEQITLTIQPIPTDTETSIDHEITTEEEIRTDGTIPTDEETQTNEETPADQGILAEQELTPEQITSIFNQ